MLNRRLGLLGAASALTGAVACGDPIAPGDFEGQPFMKIQGIICGSSGDASPQGSVGIVWKSYGDAASVVPGETGRVETKFLPADFAFDVFATPPSAVASMLVAQSAKVEGSIGIPVFFEDGDGDGTLAVSPDGLGGVGGTDRLLGISRGQVLLFVHSVDVATDASFGSGLQLSAQPEEIRSGYQLADTVCDENGRQRGLRIIPGETPIDIDLLDGAIDSAVDGAVEAVDAPRAPPCITLF